MRIGIDVRKYSDLGIGTYIRTLLAEYDKTPKHDLVLFASEEEAGQIRSKHRGEVVVERAGKYSARELVALSAQARAHRCDLFHAPHYTLPFFLPCPSVVTIHDLIHLKFPESFSLMKRAYARTVIGHACSASDAIIVDAEFTRQDIIQTFRVKPEKIHVVHLGVRREFTEALAGTASRPGSLSLPEGTPYVLYVGSLKPHKNVPVLLKAFAGLTDLAQLRLVLSGEPLDEDAGLRSLARELGIRERIVDAGRVSTEGLVWLYRNASVVVLPSHYEGFGLPILEAMACGTPFIGARSASIPEVAGEGGLLFDPNDPFELARLIRAVVTDPSLREAQRAYGLANAKRFSREAQAAQTMQIYESIVPRT
jgi:glycosyltransferase involved in cell wall biosynthesis